MKNFIHCLLVLLALTGWSRRMMAATGNPGTFVFTGSLNLARVGHAAVLLADGRVLIVGGQLTNGFGTASVEIYNPATGLFTSAGDMLEVRGPINSAAVLTNGRVLISGSGQSVGVGTTRCEMFVPSTGQFVDTGDPTRPFTAQTFTVMKDGRVLMVEGRDNERAAEIYNPASGSWTPLADTINPQWGHHAVLLPDGRVLLGGSLQAGLNAEVFNPATETFAIAGQFLGRRALGSLILLTNGLIFSAGGSPDLPSAELFNVTTGTSTNVGFLNVGRQYHTTTLLTNGEVLLVGGVAANTAILRSAEIFEPATRQFRGTGSLRSHRAGHTATRLLDGRVLIVGGVGQDRVPLATAELYNPSGVNNLPFISAWEASGPEGNSTTNTIAFQVQLSKTHTATVAVNYATHELTAHPTGDYLTATGRVTFPPGVTNQTVLIATVPERLYEPDETFLLTLEPNSATNGIVERGQALGTILNDEAFPTVLVAPASVVEGQRGLTYLVFNVFLSTPSQTDIFVSCVTADGTARVGEDYVAVTNQLYFAASLTNQQVVVPVKGDYGIETDETILLQLFSVTNAAPGPAGVGTIVNDDGLPGVLHHYAIAPIASPQFKQIPTNVVIEAQDALNQHVHFSGPLDLFIFATNPPTLVTDFDDGTLNGWTPLNVGTSPGPYEVVSLDIDGDFHDSPAFRIDGINSVRDGLARDVQLVAGTSYRFSCDVRQVYGRATYGGGGMEFWLRINGQIRAYNFPPFEVGGFATHTRVSEDFTPATNGPCRVELLFYRPSNEPSSLAYLDNFEIRPQPFSIRTVNMNSGWGTASLAWQMPMTDARLMARDREGRPPSLSNPFAVVAAADLILQSTIASGTHVGQDIQWSVQVRNQGPDTATGVTLTNFLPAGFSFLSVTGLAGGTFTNDGGVVRCELGMMPVGAVRDLHFFARAPYEGIYTNVASVQAGEPDPFPANNAAMLPISVTPPIISFGDPFQLVPAYATENPGGSVLEFPLLLGAPRTNAVTVEYYTAPSGATPGLDYLPASGIVAFAPGVTQQVVQVTVLDDALDEFQETLVLLLTNAVNAALAGWSNTGVILDNGDAPGALFLGDAGAVVEGDSGTTSQTFNVFLSPPSGKQVSFRYVAQSGSAAAGSDFVATNAEVILAPGQTNASFAIQVRGNTVNEPDEFFEVRLTNQVNATLGRALATGMILNDDAVPGRLDHFVFSSVPSPQAAGRPVSFTIQAVDAFEVPFTNFFNGSVTLTAVARTNQISVSVSPVVLSNFVAGCWTGVATLAASNPLVVLKVSDAAEHTGQSNPFDVLSAIPMSVTLPVSATEGDGVLAGAGLVTLGAPQLQDVTVSLSTGTEALAPSAVVVPAGQTNAVFDITVVDDANFDGSRGASVTATAAFFTTHTATMAVHDNEHGVVTLSLPGTAREGDGPVELSVTIWPPTHTGVSLIFSNSAPSETGTPFNPVVPAGLTSFVMGVAITDDGRLDGTQLATISASIPNWTVTPATIAVLDNESTNLTLTFGWQGPYREGVNITNLRNVRISGTLPTNLTVSLASSDESEIIVPPSVTILAGQLSAGFNATLPDDADFDGVQNVLLTASAPGFGPVTNTIPVSDNDVHHLSFNTYPKSAFVGTTFTVQVNARDINDVTISSPRLPLVLTAAGDHGPVPLGFIIDPPFGLETGARMSVRALAVDTNVRITVTTTNGLSLIGLPFDVTPPMLQYPGVAAVDAAYDPAGQRLYAVVPTNAATHAGRLVRVAPDTGAVETSVVVGFDPARVIVDDLGRYAYVTGTNGLIRRIRLNDLAADLDIQLDAGLAVEDFAVMPGHPGVLAVARRNTCCTPRHADVRVYDNGVPRAVSPALAFGPNRIEFGATSNRLYGINTESNDFTYFRLDVSSAGLTVDGTTNGFGGFAADFRFGGARVYATSGQVRDAETGTNVATLPWSGSVAVDASLARIFYLRLFSGSTWRLESLVESNFAYAGFTNISSTSSATNLLRCGADTLAFINALGLGLIHTALVFDTDADGLRDDWERAHFGGLETPGGAPGADPDLDGRTNAEEFQSGTNPTNAASVLRIATAGAGRSITFGTVVGKRYRLLRSATVNGSWQTVEDNIVGTGGPVTVADGSTGTNSFYRIQLVP